MILIDQHSEIKKKKFHQVFHQGCLEKISANPQITSDLRTLAEEILDGKLQNLQNSPQLNVFSVWPCTLHTTLFSIT